MGFPSGFPSNRKYFYPEVARQNTILSFKYKIYFGQKVLRVSDIADYILVLRLKLQQKRVVIRLLFFALS